MLSDTQKGFILSQPDHRSLSSNNNNNSSSATQHERFCPLTSSNHKLKCHVAVITQTTHSFAIKTLQSARDSRRRLGCGEKITSDWLLNRESRLVKDYKRSNKSGRRRKGRRAGTRELTGITVAAQNFAFVETKNATMSQIIPERSSK